MRLSGHEKSLADAGQAIHAIKALRTRTGATLKDSKDAVEEYLGVSWMAAAGTVNSRTRGSRRVLEHVYWVLKRGDRYASSGHTRLGNIVGWTPLRSLADEFERRSDAFDERTEDMKTLGFKVVRVTVWRVKK